MRRAAVQTHDAGPDMTPLIVTSLDPADRLVHQRRCVAVWESLGCEVVSINTPDQAEQLRKLGAITTRIVETPAEAGPGPHILSVLTQVQQTWPGRRIVLVKPDVFPAVADAGFIDMFLQAAPALALTREQTGIVEGYGFADRARVPGRIDTFIMGPDSLERIITGLSQWSVANLMRFDVFGWEYLLAAVIAAPGVGGQIMDGGVLLHERHRINDRDAADSAPFMEPLAALGLLDGAPTDPLPARFAVAVAARCQTNAAVSARIKALCFKAPGRNSSGSTRAQGIALRVQNSVPWAGWNYNFHTLTALADRILSGETFAFFHLSQVFQTGPSRHHQFAEALLAVLFDVIGHAAPDRRIVTHYPQHHGHAPAVIALMGRHKDDPVQRRLELARLFGTEMVDLRVFNSRLFDALVLSCQNDDERALLDHIYMNTKEILDAA